MLFLGFDKVTPYLHYLPNWAAVFCSIFFWEVGIKISRKPFVVFRCVRRRAVDKMFCQPVKPPIGACLLPEFLAAFSNYPPPISSFPPFNKVGWKGAGLTKLWIEPVTWCQISKILSRLDKPLSEYILFIQNCFSEVWRNISRKIPIPFCSTCHLVEQELKIWKVT